MPSGIYERSEEWKRDFSKKMMGKKPWNTGLTKGTDPRVKAQAEKVTGRHQAPEHARKLAISRKGRSIWNTGLTAATDDRVKRNVEEQTKAQRIRFADPIEKMYWLSTVKCGHTRGTPEHYVSLFAGKVYLRSTWESLYARWLDENNIPWEYEKIFVYYNQKDGTKHMYKVDFHLLNGGGKYCVECKGYMDETCQLKKEAFYKNYPDMFMKTFTTAEELSKLRFKTWKVELKNNGFHFTKL